MQGTRGGYSQGTEKGKCPNTVRPDICYSEWLPGKQDGDQSDLWQWLPPPASFAPRSPERCLDEADWWLWRLCGPEPVAIAQGGATRLTTLRSAH